MLRVEYFDILMYVHGVSGVTAYISDHSLQKLKLAEGPWCHAWNQKDARFGYLILKVVIPSDPVTTSFLFKIYVYIRLNANK